MPAHRSTSTLRKTRLRRTASATLAATGICALALTAVPASADSKEVVTTHNARAVSWDVKAADIPGQRQPADALPAEEIGARAELAPGVQSALADAVAGQRSVAADATREAECEAERAERRAEREAEAQAEREAAEERESEETTAPAPAAEEQAEEQEEEPATAAAPAETPAEAAAQEPAPEEPAAEEYPDNLDGWIREALDVMAEKGIPGTYDGLHRNIIRESSGDPNAINLWDINAINGTPSIGLLQVIQPTFDAYHVEGTPYDIYDPVANLTAAANYAWDRYGSIDNVNGPY
ncbi:transglycosylase SLT domain-containing protein [Streptomyces sp. SBT349]|uniref:transglycosylase SLT domain-containing protein n=1 Tax=Streptomyces sp. SBT349 TaxID=1580539 RepID=UPI00069F30F6|nr:transglycosylase SLT domain-containing protein [Streptomyces sp. SBT349]